MVHQVSREEAERYKQAFSPEVKPPRPAPAAFTAPPPPPVPVVAPEPVAVVKSVEEIAREQAVEEEVEQRKDFEERLQRGQVDDADIDLDAHRKSRLVNLAELQAWEKEAEERRKTHQKQEEESEFLMYKKQLGREAEHKARISHKFNQPGLFGQEMEQSSHFAAARAHSCEGDMMQSYGNPHHGMHGHPHHGHPSHSQHPFMGHPRLHLGHQGFHGDFDSSMPHHPHTGMPMQGDPVADIKMRATMRQAQWTSMTSMTSLR